LRERASFHGSAGTSSSREELVRASLACIVAFMLATSAWAERPACVGYADYFRYCSACHGEEADGKGPVANVLTPPPPALTSLHKRFGSPLSTRLVAFVSGTSMPRAHGTSDMPVWGKVFREEMGDDRAAVDLLWTIVGYLECIQTEERRQ
jgi:hypothetical protein